MSRRSSYTDRKGVELTLQTIIVAILVLIVLVVLSAVFSKFVGKSITEYLGITDATSQEIRGEKCSSTLLGRSCVQSESACRENDYGTPIPGTWPDCTDGAICCERTTGRAEGPGVLG